MPVLYRLPFLVRKLPFLPLSKIIAVCESPGSAVGSSALLEGSISRGPKATCRLLVAVVLVGDRARSPSQRRCSFPLANSTRLFRKDSLVYQIHSTRSPRSSDWEPGELWANYQRDSWARVFHSPAPLSLEKEEQRMNPPWRRLFMDLI